MLCISIYMTKKTIKFFFSNIIPEAVKALEKIWVVADDYYWEAS